MQSSIFNIKWERRALYSDNSKKHLARHSERRKKTRQTEKRWEVHIREWTGLEFGKSQRAVENRGKWRILAAESSVVPQQPSRLMY